MNFIEFLKYLVILSIKIHKILRSIRFFMFIFYFGFFDNALYVLSSFAYILFRSLFQAHRNAPVYTYSMPIHSYLHAFFVHQTVYF